MTFVSEKLWRKAVAEFGSITGYIFNGGNRDRLLSNADSSIFCYIYHCAKWSFSHLYLMYLLAKSTLPLNIGKYNMNLIYIRFTKLKNQHLIILYNNMYYESVNTYTLILVSTKSVIKKTSHLLKL
jgi:hypothetical protein